MQLVASLPTAHYITVNQGELNIPTMIADRAIGFNGSIQQALTALLTGQLQDLQLIAPVATPAVDETQLRQALEPFYPHFLANPTRSHTPGQPLSMTIDQTHPVHLHTTQFGRPWMYAIGDTAIMHCFVPGEGYSTVRLGLNQARGEVHGTYLPAGTIVAIEVDPNGVSGFSQLTTELPDQAQPGLLVPKVAALIKEFPNQVDLIRRFSAPTD